MNNGENIGDIKISLVNIRWKHWQMDIEMQNLEVTKFQVTYVIYLEKVQCWLNWSYTKWQSLILFRRNATQIIA